MTDNDKNFNGVTVGAFESRRADEMARLIEKAGGVSRVSPSMREVALDDQTQAVDFANRIITGQVDIMIVTTGVGFRHWIDAVERKVDIQRFTHALTDMTTIARGPKAAAAMRKAGITPTHSVPEPNTWREVLQVVDTQVPVAGQSVGVQEYGKTNPSLIAGLEARGARVASLSVYRWDLPEQLDQIEANVRDLAERKIEVVLFTSAQQVTNLFKVASQLDMAVEVREGLRAAVIASIGPTTSEMLRDSELPVDLEPAHAKMGQLVQAAAQKCEQILRRKRQIAAVLSSPSNPANDVNAPWHNSPFMKACRREPTDVTPIWLMRQAGRYMAEYREIRAKTTFLDLCKNPALCSEIMITAVNRLGVDAAIIFSDLLPILEPMGMDLEYAQGEGPLIHNPLREGSDVDRMLELESADSLHFVMETVKMTRADLPDHIPLIGFSGSPFTLASYAIEGGASRNYLHTKTLMYRDEGAWRQLMLRLSRAIVVYLNAQIAAGCQCVQLFDSWAGCLGPDDYRKYVLPYLQTIISEITPGVPVINFATGNPALLPLLAEGGSAVVGIDWRVRLDQAWQTVGHDLAVQGNLDPVTLLSDRKEIRRRAAEVLKQAAGRPGHIFNLGHGVLQQTPVDNAIALIDAVHELSQR